MRTASRFLIVIIFLGVVLGGIFGYKFYQFGQMQEQMSQPQPPAQISAIEAKNEAWTPAIKAVGSVEAINAFRWPMKFRASLRPSISNPVTW